MNPKTPEQALSALSFAVAALRNNPPTNADELNRMREMIGAADNIQVRASRAMINQMETPA